MFRSTPARLHRRDLVHLRRPVLRDGPHRAWLDGIQMFFVLSGLRRPCWWTATQPGPGFAAWREQRGTALAAAGRGTGPRPRGCAPWRLIAGLMLGLATRDQVETRSSSWPPSRAAERAVGPAGPAGRSGCAAPSLSTLRRDVPGAVLAPAGHRGGHLRGLLRGPGFFEHRKRRRLQPVLGQQPHPSTFLADLDQPTALTVELHRPAGTRPGVNITTPHLFPVEPVVVGR